MKIANRYEIRELLAEGGMGLVYRAWDQSTNRDVALKTMRDPTDEIALELFAKERQVLARLSHPNIVDILDSGEWKSKDGRRPFFVMPLLPGVTLDRIIAGSPRGLPEERVIKILLQACGGLQAAHSRGLIHRDIKTGNILVLEDDSVKVIDFGVVHLTGGQSIVGLKGTLHYMAPEQLELSPATSASDVFSLGVVAYEALTGHNPFLRTTDSETAAAIRSHDPPRASELNPAVSNLVSCVVRTAIAKLPRYRFASPRAMAEALEKAARNEPIARYDPARIRSRVERAKTALAGDDLELAGEILAELDADGQMDAEATELRDRVQESVRHKKIKQYLESARLRAEEGDFARAAQGAAEALALDPGNSEAASLRDQIQTGQNEREIAGHLSLAKQRFRERAFTEARRSAEQVLAIAPDHQPARDLLREIERREASLRRLREQRERLYNAAQAAFRGGEFDAAVHDIDRALELCRGTPDRHAQKFNVMYQSFAAQARGEREALRSAVAGCREYVVKQDFARALESCEEWLRRYPESGRLRALKLEIGGQRIAAEGRELVNALRARAQECEEQGRLAEAAGHLETLQSVCPDDPRLAVEIERLRSIPDRETPAEIEEYPGLDIQPPQVPHREVSGDRKRVFAPIEEAVPPPRPVPEAEKFATAVAVPLPRKNPPAGPQHLRVARLGMVAAGAGLLLCWFAFSGPWQNRKTAASAPKDRFRFRFQIAPPDAKILIDGRPAPGFDLELPVGEHRLEASKPGFRSESRVFAGGPGSASALPMDLELTPEPSKILVSSDLQNGRVLLDGTEVGPLAEGTFGSVLSGPGKHTIALMDGAAEILAFRFQANPGKPAALLEAPRTNALVDAAIVSSLGNTAFYYGPVAQNEVPVILTADGASAPPGRPVDFGWTFDGLRPRSEISSGKRILPVETGNAPALSIWVHSRRDSLERVAGVRKEEIERTGLGFAAKPVTQPSEPTAHPYLLNPFEWEQDGRWWHRTGSGTGLLGYSPGGLLFSFPRNSRRFLILKGRVRITADYQDDGNYVEYEFDTRRLYRRRVIHGRSEQQIAAPFASRAAAKILRFEIDGGRIAVKDEAGHPIDSVDRPAPSAAAGKFRVGGEARVAIP